MKKFILAFLISMGTMDQEVVWAETSAVPKPTDKFFFKAGAGLLEGQVFFKHYNRPEISGIPAQINETLVGGPDLSGSTAAGIDCPDNFPYFVSGEWFTRDWSLMANVQYNFGPFGVIEPYLYTGIGLDFMNRTTLGLGAQLGIGTNLELAQGFNLFMETKFYATFGDWTSAIDPAKSFTWETWYVPVLAGIKFNP